jgi:hypothetical protein
VGVKKVLPSSSDMLKGDDFFLARWFPVSHLIAYTLVDVLSSTIGRDPLWFSVKSVARR